MEHERKILIGCSTIPSRLKYIPRVLEQVKKQTVKPDIFCLSIPKFSTREKVPYNIEEAEGYLKEEGLDFEARVSILDEDYGPLCKLAGMLAIAPINSIIITIDDDHEYDKKLIETLLEGKRQYPNSAVCLCGHALGRIFGDVYLWGYRQTGFDKNLLGNVVQLNNGDSVDIISGWAGVLYTRDMFGDGVGLKLPEELEFYRKYRVIKRLHQNDDLYISAWLSRNDINRVVIKYNSDYCQKLVKEIGKVNPLCQSGHTNWYKGHVVHFVEWWNLIHELTVRGYFKNTSPVSPNKSFTLCGTLAATALITLTILIFFKVISHVTKLKK